MIDEERPVSACGLRATVQLRSPDSAARRPALLIYLAMDRHTNLDVPPYRILPDEFLAAGHRVASFDLPNHGELVDRYGESLTGIAAAMADGVDVFGRVAELGRSTIQSCTADMAKDTPVFVAGTSRGGLSALHVMAAIPSVRAAAAFAPVTELAALHEFAHLASSPLLRRSCAISLVDRLAGRPLFVTIGRDDERVGTENCLAFCRALRAAGSEGLVLTVTDEPGHTVPEDCYRRGAAFFRQDCE